MRKVYAPCPLSQKGVPAGRGLSSRNIRLCNPRQADKPLATPFRGRGQETNIKAGGKSK